jgi:hypothetical protein
LALALFLFASAGEIHRDLKQNPDWRTYFTKDAMHYYVAAEAFASGDFSMSYEKRWPYRQPLFPLLVAAVIKVTNANLFAIRMVNVGVIVLATTSLFLILRAFWSDSVTASIISILFVLNPFVYDQSVHGLNTEPLHLFLLICAVSCFLRYLTVRHWIYLWLLGLAVGLDYLDRINGFFLAIAAFTVLICFECRRYRQSPNTERRMAIVPWWHYAIAMLILVAVTTPSWLSRLRYFGNPFYYGAIQNFLWGDTYLGSMDSPRMLTAADYFSSHSLFDAAGRFLLGCWKVFFIIPIDRERLPLLYFAAVAGIWLAWRQRQTPYCWLLFFYGLQMLPLAWTQPVNTTPRIPYAATQPFELFFAAIFVHWLWSKVLPDRSTE